MDIIFVRHGETDWNSAKRYQGQVDVALNDKGREQAQIAADKIANLHLNKGIIIKAIYSSDLIRAVETALYIAEPLGLEVTQSSKIRELAFGSWEGLTFERLQKKYEVLFTEWFNNPWHFVIPKGESLHQLYQRSSSFMSDIKAKQQQFEEGSTIVVVTHGGVIKALRAHSDSSYDIWDVSLQPGDMLHARIVNDDIIFETVNINEEL